MPALNATTGMPAAMAFFTAGMSAGGSGSVTAMPSTLLSMALWIRLAWLPDDASDEYLKVTLSFAEAASAPLRMMSQNVSPGAPWVTMAIVMRGVVALPAETPPVSSSDFLPPVLLHAAPASARIAISAVPAARLLDLNMCSASVSRGFSISCSCCCCGLHRGREVHVRAVMLAVLDVRPADGDGLGAGVEADALRAVDVGVPEQRVLPPSEGVEGHRHRDRDVDADH